MLAVAKHIPTKVVSKIGSAKIAPAHYEPKFSKKTHACRFALEGFRLFVGPNPLFYNCFDSAEIEFIVDQM